MATRFYFHNDTNALTGTFPTTEQAGIAASVTSTGANTLRTMDLSIGTAQTTATVTSLASTAVQNHFMRFFCSPPLVGDQTVGGGTMILNAADAEGNNNANWWINSLNVYVWRPSTGTKVGTVRDDAGTSLGGLEGGTGETVSHVTGITSSAISALDGDVIICEVWVRAQQSASMSYTNTFYFDGTTVNTTENASVTNHASFLEMSENLIFSLARPRSFGIII
jgi:hypothetical protein